jgi:hypothetical protein
MKEKKVMKFSELETGEKLPEVRYEITDEKIEEYKKIFGDSEGVLPPFLCSLYAVKSLFEKYSIQPGTIHAFQEVELFKEIKFKDRTFRSYGEVKEKYSKRGKNYAIFEIITEDLEGNIVNRIKFGFVIPE